MEKGIIIVNENMPSGLKANICAILGMALGKNYPDIVGPNIFTRDQKEISGITQIPLPILQSSPQKLAEIFHGNQNMNLFMVVFDDSALTTKNCTDFQEKLSSVLASEVQIHGFLAYGPKKTINRIGADIPLLK